MGLPKGWTAVSRPNSRYTFRNPEGTQRFLSKKAVYDHCGLPMPPPKPYTKCKKKKSLPSSSSENENDNESENGSGTESVSENDSGSSTESEHDEPSPKTTTTTPPPQNDTNTSEEGDPPWRTSNHKYLGRRVRYQFPGSDEGMHDGVVKGWIADMDVDTEGEPGFVSEQSGKPAALFHVRFDVNRCPFSSQDLEEFELVKCLTAVNREDAGDLSSDDNEALSETIKHVLKRGRAKKGPGRPRKS